MENLREVIIPGLMQYVQQLLDETQQRVKAELTVLSTPEPCSSVDDAGALREIQHSTAVLITGQRERLKSLSMIKTALCTCGPKVGDNVVSIQSLVKVRDEAGKYLLLLILPVNESGIMCHVYGHDVCILSQGAPLAMATLRQSQGDDVTVLVGNNEANYHIEGVY